MPIVREPVGSSAIRSFGYDSVSQTLEVEYLNGKVYQYYNVSDAIFQELKAAASKGQFINAYIRPSYPFSLVG